MRKRITIQVDKLIGRHHKKHKPDNDCNKIASQKSLSFEQMYQMARKVSLNNQGRHPRVQNYLSCSPGNVVESLKNSKKTPHNSNRNQERKNEVHQKLNRSLQAKSNSLEKAYASKSNSIGRKRCEEGQNEIEKWKAQKYQKNVQQQRKSKQQASKEVSKTSNNYTSEYQSQGKEEFKTQYTEVISHLDHQSHEHLRETQCFLSVEQTFQVLRKLHYLRKLEDEKFLLKIWQELEGETYSGIPSNNLFQFLSYINHYSTNLVYPKQKITSTKRITINRNLKIVTTQQAKLQIYEDYLTLRVNRILYGGSQNDICQQLQRTSIIKIIDQEHQNEQKKKVVLTLAKRGFAKQKVPKDSITNDGLKRSIRLKSADYKTAIKNEETSHSEQALEKQKSEDTICNSEFSQSKQSLKNLNCNDSQSSLQASDIIQQLVIKKPILSVDVNLGEGVSQKLMVFEGESAYEVSKRLVDKYNIDESMRIKFETMLNNHIRNMLWRIEQVSEDMFSDREE